MTEMRNETWSRLKEVLANALELPTGEREAYLDRACEGDAVLRRDVDELLAAHVEAAGRLGEAGDDGPERAVGPYKLLQPIGEGGFGVVYMAEQKEPIRRRVAVKIIKLGMDTKQVIARFEAERQALAMMDHPGIAKVLDAGATDSGRPYFVMELVGGVPITEFCDANRLDTEERLDLFQQVCRAVQHAHQKGIIHRDLKPNNVLVAMHDGQPLCKIIDFGIAKATSGGLTDKTLFTEFRQFIGTPQYMSPEQATLGGIDVDTRSDIYSLGVLLYELLTGAPPISEQRLRDAALDEMKRIISEEDPVLPSTRVSTRGDALGAIARARSLDPAQLVRSLRGDLDWIVLRALEKDRSRRYATANELVDDIERHRAHEPVTASPPTLAYRTRKFVRRHRGPVLAGVAVLLAVLVGLAGTSLALAEAREERALAAAEARRRGAVADFLAEVLTAAAVTEQREFTTSISVLDLLDEAAERLENSQLVDDPESFAKAAVALADGYWDQWQVEPAVRLADTAVRALGDGPADPFVYSEAARALAAHASESAALGWDDRKLHGLHVRTMQLLEPELEAREPEALRALMRWSRLDDWDAEESERSARRFLALVEGMSDPPIPPVLVMPYLTRALTTQGELEEAERWRKETARLLRGHIRRGEADLLVEFVLEKHRVFSSADLETISRVAETIRDRAAHTTRTATALIQLCWGLPWPNWDLDPMWANDRIPLPEHEHLAESLCRTARTIFEKELGPDHSRVGNCLYATASCLPRSAFDERVALFRRALAIGGQDARHTIEMLGDFASVLLLRARSLGVDDPSALPLVHEADGLVREALELARSDQGADEFYWGLASRWGAAGLLAEMYGDLVAAFPGNGQDGYADRARYWKGQHRDLLSRMLDRAERQNRGRLQVARTLLTIDPPELREPERARRLARGLCESFVSPASLDTLALAEFSCGDATRAAEVQRQAIALLPEGNELLPSFHARLTEYENALAE